MLCWLASTFRATLPPALSVPKPGSLPSPARSHLQIHFAPIPGDSVDRLIAEGEVFWCAGGLMVVSCMPVAFLFLLCIPNRLHHLAAMPPPLNACTALPGRLRQTLAALWECCDVLKRLPLPLVAYPTLEPCRSMSWCSRTSSKWMAAWTL